MIGTIGLRLPEMMVVLGVGSVGVTFILSLHFLVLTNNFYWVINEDIGGHLRIVKSALAVFVPVVDMVLVWAEIFFRLVAFKRGDLKLRF